MLNSDLLNYIIEEYSSTLSANSTYLYIIHTMVPDKITSPTLISEKVFNVKVGLNM